LLGSGANSPAPPTPSLSNAAVHLNLTGSMPAQSRNSFTMTFDNDKIEEEFREYKCAATMALHRRTFFALFFIVLSLYVYGLRFEEEEDGRSGFKIVILMNSIGPLYWLSTLVASLSAGLLTFTQVYPRIDNWCITVNTLAFFVFAREAVNAIEAANAITATSLVIPIYIIMQISVAVHLRQSFIH
jgi:hypothetical protein